MDPFRDDAIDTAAAPTEVHRAPGEVGAGPATTPTPIPTP